MAGLGLTWTSAAPRLSACHSRTLGAGKLPPWSPPGRWMEHAALHDVSSIMLVSILIVGKKLKMVNTCAASSIFEDVFEAEPCAGI